MPGLDPMQPCGHPALAPLYIAHAVALQDDVERPLSEAVTYGRPAVPGCVPLLLWPQFGVVVAVGGEELIS